MSTLSVLDHKKRRTIPISKIEYVTGDGNYSTLHIVGEKPVVVSRTLKVMEARLSGFVRIHKRTLVNPQHIMDYTLQPTVAFVKLTDDRALLVSRRRVQSLKVYANTHR